MWTPCRASVADGSVNLARFGHTTTIVRRARPAADQDLIVVYGGVAAQHGRDGSAHAQKALGDVLALCGSGARGGAWTQPDVVAPAGGGPGPRAFHSAAAVGPQGLLVFGGHILMLEAGSGRKKRLFFNDLWSLDVVSRSCCAVHQLVPPEVAGWWLIR